MSITDHKTRSIFDRYDITNEDDLRDAAREMQAYSDAPTTTRNVVALPVRAAADDTRTETRTGRGEMTKGLAGCIG